MLLFNVFVIKEELEQLDSIQMFLLYLRLTIRDNLLRTQKSIKKIKKKLYLKVLYLVNRYRIIKIYLFFCYFVLYFIYIYIYIYNQYKMS